MSIASMPQKIVKLALAATVSLLVAAPSSRAAPRPPAIQFDAANWLVFETDACGHLGRVDSRHSAAILAAAADNRGEDDDEDEWVNAWIMPPGESALVNDWLLQHPEIVTVTDAVQKSCVGDEVTPIDDSEEPDIA